VKPSLSSAASALLKDETAGMCDVGIAMGDRGLLVSVGELTKESGETELSRLVSIRGSLREEVAKGSSDS